MYKHLRCLQHKNMCIIRSAAGGEGLLPNGMGRVLAKLTALSALLYRASWLCCWMQMSNSSSRHAADTHAGSANKDSKQHSTPNSS